MSLIVFLRITFMAYLLAMGVVFVFFEVAATIIAMAITLGATVVRVGYAAHDRDGRCAAYLIAIFLGGVLGFYLAKNVFAGSVGHEFAQALIATYQDYDAPWWPVFARFLMVSVAHSGLAILTLAFLVSDTQPRPLLSLSPSVVFMGFAAASVGACWAAISSTQFWLDQLPT